MILVTPDNYNIRCCFLKQKLFSEFVPDDSTKVPTMQRVSQSPQYYSAKITYQMSNCMVASVTGYISGLILVFFI